MSGAGVVRTGAFFRVEVWFAGNRPGRAARCERARTTGRARGAGEGRSASAGQTQTFLAIGRVGQLAAADDAVTAEAKSGCTPSWASMTLRPT